jgi:hypothetical protein
MQENNFPKRKKKKLLILNLVVYWCHATEVDGKRKLD